MLRHFLELTDLSAKEILQIIDNAIIQKNFYKKNEKYKKQTLTHKTVLLIFDKPSTRTRLSFQSGINLMGGNALVVDNADTQFGRGESVSDSARVMSRFAQIIMIRTFEQTIIEEMAEFSDVPVINGLTNEHHPCQILADLMTWKECLQKNAKNSTKESSFKGRVAAWLGDANNVSMSWAQAANILGFDLRLSIPQKFNFSKTQWQQWQSAKKVNVEYVEDPKKAVVDAELVITDSWVSMGFEKSRANSDNIFKAWQVNSEIMSLAKKSAIFMHCLPAYRDKEVTAEVIDGKQSVVWDEAENRMFAQNALMEFLINKAK